MPLVAQRSALLVALLLAILALLAPLAAVADSCPDCGPTQGCCPTLGCPCCLSSASVLTTQARVDLGLASTAIAGDPPADRVLSADPRDVFHVPKSLLA
jgi:hypothetical protein